MKPTFPSLSLRALLVVLAGGLPVAGQAQLANPGFETGDFTGWETYGNYAFVSPLAGLVNDDYFFPAGDFMAVIGSGSLVDVSWYEAQWGVSFPDPTLTTGSAIATTIDLLAGQAVTFAFLFMANDGFPNNDSAYFVATGAATDVVLLASMRTPGVAPAVGEFYSFSDWHEFTYQAPVDGRYTLAFAMFDSIYTVYPSFLLLDDAPGTAPARPRPVPEATSYGTLAAALLALIGCRRRWAKR